MKTDWGIKRLDELCDIRVGRTPSRNNPAYWGGQHPWVTIRELTGGILTDSAEKITKLAVTECMSEPVPVGTLLFSFKLSIGKTAVTGCPLYTNEAIAALIIRDPNLLIRDFLMYALRTINTDLGANEAVLGTLLNKKSLSSITIPIPLLSEQKHIVSILDAADELRKLRVQADKHTAELIPAIFYDMFGDPATNIKGWPVDKLGNLAVRITKGESPHWQGFSYVEHGIPFLTSENVLWGSLCLANVKMVAREFHSKLRRSAVRKGDVLVNLVGASIGRSALVPESLVEGNVNQAVAVITLRDSLMPQFLLGFLLAEQTQSILHQGKVDSARANISLTDLRNLKVMIPPLELQREFAGRVTEIRDIETKQTKSRGGLDSLFQSLLHRAFEGEL